MQIDLRHLRTLIALRDTGSLVEAAERVFLTQSALSHQIKELETRLGCSVFIRKTRPVRFTSTFNPGQLRIEFERQNDTIGLRGSGHLARLTIEALIPGPTRVISASGSLRDAGGASLSASFASMRIEVQ